MIDNKCIKDIILKITIDVHYITEESCREVAFLAYE